MKQGKNGLVAAWATQKYFSKARHDAATLSMEKLQPTFGKKLKSASRKAHGQTSVPHYNAS